MVYAPRPSGSEEGSGNRQLMPIDQDPYLARAEMGLSGSGSESADVVNAGANVGASKGGEMMGLLAMLFANGGSGGEDHPGGPAGNQPQPQGFNPAPAAKAAGDIATDVAKGEDAKAAKEPQKNVDAPADPTPPAADAGSTTPSDPDDASTPTKTKKPHDHHKKAALVVATPPATPPTDPAPAAATPPATPPADPAPAAATPTDPTPVTPEIPATPAVQPTQGADAGPTS